MLIEIDDNAIEMRLAQIIAKEKKIDLKIYLLQTLSEAVIKNYVTYGDDYMCFLQRTADIMIDIEKEIEEEKTQKENNK